VLDVGLGRTLSTENRAQEECFPSWRDWGGQPDPALADLYKKNLKKSPNTVDLKKGLRSIARHKISPIQCQDTSGYTLPYLVKVRSVPTTNPSMSRFGHNITSTVITFPTFHTHSRTGSAKAAWTKTHVSRSALYKSVPSA
jgi:hypothetical protein